MIKLSKLKSYLSVFILDLLVTCLVRTKKKLIKNFLPMRFEFQRDRTERSNFIPGGG